MPKQVEILTGHVPGQQNRSFLAAIPERRAAQAKPTRWGLLAGLIVAAGVSLVILVTGRPVEPVTSTGQAGRSTIAAGESRSDIDTYGPAEGGAFGNIVLPPADVFDAWAAAEGGATGASAYVPDSLAGHVGPETWAAAEGGCWGEVVGPNPPW